MSTKTSIKRIALVAVSALGFGLLSSVSANAAMVATTSYGIGAPTGKPAVVGVATSFSVPVTIVGGAANEFISVSAKMSTVPAGSTAGISNGTLPAAVKHTSGAANTGMKAGVDGGAGGGIGQVDLQRGTAAVDATYGPSATYPLSQTVSFAYTPDVAGTYVIAVWDDRNQDGVLDSGETVQYLTVTATTAPASLTKLTAVVAGPYATYSAASAPDGTWAKIQVTDAAGNATVLTGTQQVLVTVPATATLIGKIDGSNGTVTSGLTISGTQYGLVQADFDSSGVAYINIKSSTAGTSTISTQVVGGGAAASLGMVFASAATAAVARTAAVKATNIDATTNVYTGTIGYSGTLQGSANSAADVNSSSSATFTVGAETASGVVSVQVGQTALQKGFLGFTTSAAVYVDLAVTVGSTATTSTTYNGFYDATTPKYTADVTVPTVTSRNGDYTYKAFSADVYIAAFTGATVITGAGSTATTLTLKSPSSSSILAAPAATITASAKCVDNFGAAKSNVVITPTFSAASRNYGLFNMATVVTSSTGYVTVSWTDLSTSTSNLVDKLQLAGCGGLTDALIVTYNATSGFGVSAVAWSAGGGYGDATSYAGANKTAIGTGDGTSSASLTFKVTDSTGAAIAGVPVTFAVDTANSSAAIKKTSTSDYTIQYSDTSGKVTTYVYAYKPGKATVTATAGGKTATGYITWVNPNTNDDARNIAVSFANGVVSTKVTDRFGNGVNGVSVTLTRTGTGFFGNGSSSYTQAVGEDGTLDVRWSGGSGVVKAALTTKSDQSLAPAGQYDNTAGDTYTAAVAGLTTGYGASFAPAGNFEATVDVTDNSTDAIDASNEATDAANAATDAANAAAEAADAATAAAQDAQAAVAALATQVATLMAGLKAQITSLTNLIVKIQKKVRA